MSPTTRDLAGEDDPITVTDRANDHGVQGRILKKNYTRRKIRHELFELFIVPVELFVRGGSSQQMIDSISISNGTPAMPPARACMPARIEFPRPLLLIKFFAQCLPNFNHLPLRFNASDSVGISFTSSFDFIQLLTLSESKRRWFESRSGSREN
jgi:hypothetical protein